MALPAVVSFYVTSPITHLAYFYALRPWPWVLVHTPEIVHYMVERIDRVLGDNLRAADCFADPNVWVLDSLQRDCALTLRR